MNILYFSTTDSLKNDNFEDQLPYPDNKTPRSNFELSSIDESIGLPDFVDESIDLPEIIDESEGK